MVALTVPEKIRKFLTREAATVETIAPILRIGETI
jgi:hypothetical protein